MPMVSEAQRRLMFAALKNRKLRKRRGISKKAAKAMTSHDTGGKLPERSSRSRST